MDPQQTIRLQVTNSSELAVLIKVGSITYGLTSETEFKVPLLTKITIEVLSNSVLITVEKGRLYHTTEAMEEHIHLFIGVDVGSPGDGFIKTITEAKNMKIDLRPLPKSDQTSCLAANKVPKTTFSIQEVRCGDC